MNSNDRSDPKGNKRKSVIEEENINSLINVVYEDPNDELEFQTRSDSDVSDSQLRLNFLVPDFSQRICLYLKPKGPSTYLNFLYLLLDTLLCWCFLSLQFYWAITCNFTSINE